MKLTDTKQRMAALEKHIKDRFNASFATVHAYVPRYDDADFHLMVSYYWRGRDHSIFSKSGNDLDTLVTEAEAAAETSQDQRRQELEQELELLSL